ncbi:MAG: DUF3465 domain-containing protein [bacterium]|nr:DUF3465 domain-containing protein [bacterium]
MTVEEAFARRLHGVPLTVSGKVTRILTDDTDDTPHQRFIIEPEGGHTVLVAHNLKRAYRVPVKVEEEVEVHGSYVWNKYGGLIHNTHHYGGECQNGKCEPHEDGYINFMGENNPNLVNAPTKREEPHSQN